MTNMEVKHVIPAYSTTGHGEDQRERRSKIKGLLSAVKKFPKRFRKDSSDNDYFEYRHSRQERNKKSIKERFSNRIPNVDKKSLIKWGAITVIAAAILVAGSNYVKSNPTQQNNSSRTQIKGAKATQDINREFTFPLRDSSGEEISQLYYTIEKAELRDEILVQGQKATAVEGRTFLILSLKLKNEYTQAVEMDTRDYIRLSVNGNEEEWLAPDIHNDPVEVQALSTEYTRVGFAINESDENILLRVGEIQGDKEMIEIDL